MTIAVESQFKQLRSSPKKVFGASTGFEPVASVFALQCSTSWAMKAHQYTESRPIYWVHQPVKGMKHRMKWCEPREYKWSEVVTIAVELQCRPLRRSPKKSFSGLQRDSNPWPVRLRLTALPAELSRWSPEKSFFGLLRNCLNCASTTMVSYSLHKRNPSLCVHGH